MNRDEANGGADQAESIPNEASPPSSFRAESMTTIDFEDVSGGKRVIQVVYRGQFYQLRSTKNGKLILNK